MRIRIKRLIQRFSTLKPQLIKLLRRCTIIIAWVFSSTAIANPDTPTVAAGNASFETMGNTLQVTNSPGTIINWQGFSISASEITRFIQQSDLSAVLNRVTGGMSSSLQGQLLSNGKVFLINPNGIVIGNGALIDTAGFVGATLDISDQDFLSGNYRFRGNGGSITNNGVITTGPGGEVILIAPSIENAGEINAAGGEIILAAGQEVTLTSLDSEHISFLVSAPGNRAVNLGSLIAKNGAIGVFADQVTQSGNISANRVSQDGSGRIVLHGSSSTEVSGSVTAIGDGVPGGEIQILGDNITLQSASIDVTGSNGGQVLIGGEFQGRGSLPRAKQTSLDQNTVVHADAIEHGHGGEIIVWSEQSTTSLGRLTARGGAKSGDGGLVETSSRGSLDFGQPADVSATNGNPGTWLLDPEDIVIDSGKANSISSALNGGSNVNIKTADSGNGEGNITVAAAIRKTEGDDASLGLTAHSNINVNAPIESTSGKLNVSLRAGRDISVNAAIATNGGQYSAAINPALAPPEPEASEEVEEPEQSEAVEVAETAEVGEITVLAEATEQEQIEQGNAQSSQIVSQNDDEIASVSELDSSVSQEVETLSNNEDTELANIEDTAASQGISLLASIDTGGGDVFVDAGSEGLLTVNSSLNAGNTETGNTGGNIHLLGNQVGLFDDAVVNASGSSGGGTILIGGDQQGANPEIANAEAVYISESARVHADALDQGDGGQVIVFAEKAANVYGEISAQGGSNGGDGGFVETSGRQSLRVTSAPNVSAANGSAGEWLIDPATITIGAPGANGGPLTPNPFAANSDTTIGVDLIYNSLALGANVSIIANGPSALDTEGNINWIADLDLDGLNQFSTFNPSSSISLQASNDINFSASIFDSDLATTGEELEFLNLAAGGDVNFIAGASDVEINADNITITAENLSLLAEDATATNVAVIQDGILGAEGNLVLDITDTILLRSGAAGGNAILGNSGGGSIVTSDIDATNLTLIRGGATGSTSVFFTDFFSTTGTIDLTGRLTIDGGLVRGNGDITTVDLDLNDGVIATLRPGDGYALTTSGTVNIDNPGGTDLLHDWVINGGQVNWISGDIQTNRDIVNNGIFNALGDNAITTGPSASIGSPTQPFPSEADIGTVDFINNGEFIKSGTSGGSTVFGDEDIEDFAFDGEVFSLRFSPPIQFINNGTLSAEAGDILFYEVITPTPGAEPFGGFIQDNAAALTELNGGSISSQLISYTGVFSPTPPIIPPTTGTLSFLQGELTGGTTSTTPTGSSLNADVVLEDVIVSPGQSPGTLTVNGDLSANSNTVFNIELGGTTPGDYDVINVNGVATLAASTINASLINGFSPPVGSSSNRFNVINAEVLNLTSGSLNVNQPANLRAGIVAGDGSAAGSYFLDYSGQALITPTDSRPTEPDPTGTAPNPRSGGFEPVPGMPEDSTPPIIRNPFDSSDLLVSLFQQQPELEDSDINESPEFLQCY